MADSLLRLAVQLTQVTVPIIIVFGIMGNSLNIFIFTRRNLIGHACTLYFLALAVNNLFYTSVLLIFNLLADGYRIAPALQSNAFCKLFSYALNLMPTLSAYFIVLASIDRFCASSSKASYRRFSSVKMARRLILTMVNLFAAFFIGILFAFELRLDDGLGCTTRNNILFNQIFLFLEMIIYVMLAPLLMSLFGMLTICNTRRARIQPMGDTGRHRRTESQLARMLIVQVGTHLILTLPFTTIFLMLVLPIPWRGALVFRFIYITCKIPLYLSFVSPFFMYTLSAQVYREELNRLGRKLFPCFHRAIVQNVTSQNMSIPITT